MPNGMSDMQQKL